MMQANTKLRARMTEQGIEPEVQEKIAHSIGSFALYGFPESRAISFALIAYASYWLKVHRTPEFYTGLINNQPMGFYSVHSLQQDAKCHGLMIRPVSCIHSGELTEVIDDHSIRLGLRRIKGLRDETAAKIVSERERRPFSSLEDFLTRANPNVKEKRLLAKGGALNDLPLVEHWRDALWQVELPLYGDLITGRREGDLLNMMTPAERLAGIANLFVNVKTFRANKLVIVSEPFLLEEGRI